MKMCHKIKFWNGVHKLAYFSTIQEKLNDLENLNAVKYLSNFVIVFPAFGG